jgi:hypothetical protein
MKIVEYFITFLLSSKTLSFDFEQESYERLKLIDLRRYDFQFELISSFFRL